MVTAGARTDSSGGAVSIMTDARVGLSGFGSEEVNLNALDLKRFKYFRTRNKKIVYIHVDVVADLLSGNYMMKRLHDCLIDDGLRQTTIISGLLEDDKSRYLAADVEIGDRKLRWLIDRNYKKIGLVTGGHIEYFRSLSALNNYLKRG